MLYSYPSVPKQEHTRLSPNGIEALSRKTANQEKIYFCGFCYQFCFLIFIPHCELKGKQQAKRSINRWNRNVIVAGDQMKYVFHALEVNVYIYSTKCLQCQLVLLSG